MGNAPSALPSTGQAAVKVRSWERRALKRVGQDVADGRRSRVTGQESKEGVEAEQARRGVGGESKRGGSVPSASWPGVDGGMGSDDAAQLTGSGDTLTGPVDAASDESGTTSTRLGGSLAARNSHQQLSWRSSTTRGESSIGESPSHYAAASAAAGSADSSLPGTPTHATMADGTITMSKPKVRAVLSTVDTSGMKTWIL